MLSTSSFTDVPHEYPNAIRLSVGGATCECYSVRLHGKLHFLKRLKPELRTDPRYVAALQKEFETGYQLDHPHLVRYVSLTDCDLLMDYVDGETLSQFAEHHPDYFKTRRNAKRFLLQLLSVVSYLHKHQVLHLDLKPDNILITRVSHDVKLIDLGFCYTDSYIDTTGHTDKYAAPEQINGSTQVDVRTDIYAIGRILQALPFPSAYDKLIKKCTKDDPEKRYQSVEELMVAVEKINNRKRWLWLLLPFLFLLLFVVYLTTHQNLFLPEKETGQPLAPAPSSVERDTSRLAEHSDESIELKDEAVVLKDDSLALGEVSENSLNDQSSPFNEEEPSHLNITEDTLALRREIQSLIEPRFQKALGHYNDSIYDLIDKEQYVQARIDFEESLFPLHAQISQKYKGKVKGNTIETEWCQTIQYYELTQFGRMKRNDSNHDSFYDNKVYHYYDADCW